MNGPIELDLEVTFQKRVKQLLETATGATVEIEPRIVVGPARYAGASGWPLPGTAARLTARVGNEIGQAWFPWPGLPPEQERGPAALFLRAGRWQALPIVRLFDRDDAGSAPRYLDLADWWDDALNRWTFRVSRTGSNSQEGSTDGKESRNEALSLAAAIAEMEPNAAERADLAAFLLHYSLLGAAEARGITIGRLRLRLPAAPSRLRPVGPTPFARACAAARVTTQVLPSAAPRIPRPPHPDTDRELIEPTTGHDRGIDPVHTPDSADARREGHLGRGVVVEAGQLSVSSGAGSKGPALSVSTDRIPYSGYNDPRRCLLGARMQEQAVSLVESQPPRTRGLGDGLDPPGVNLRVGYLAWQGLNHEDAWVLSESAAKSLTARRRVEVYVLVGAHELPPKEEVGVGDSIAKGKLLVTRAVAPVLDGSENEASRSDSSPPKLVETAPCDGKIVNIERWDFYKKEGYPKDWSLAPSVGQRYAGVIRFTIERDVPLEMGDKLANRHGHKGIVGAILPDAAMPRWRGQPLEALIDPIGVLNRSNWGQLHETLAGALIAESEDAEVVADALLEQAQAKLDTNARGQSLIQPPENGDWLSQEVRAFAGRQFLMRLPQEARAALRTSMDTDGKGRQRLGEMDRWALWAHDVSSPPPSDRGLNAPARQFLRMLLAAGVEGKATDKQLELKRLSLHGEEPPAGLKDFLIDLSNPAPPAVSPTTDQPDAADVEAVASRKKGAATKQATRSSWARRAAISKQLAEWPADQAALLKLPVVVEDVYVRALCAVRGDREAVRWVPLPARGDRPDRRRGGRSYPDPLSVLIRKIIRAALEPDVADPESVTHERLRRLLRDYFNETYTRALGRDESSSKRSLLRRRVLGVRLPRSARAVIAPAGNLGLELDEVGLPLEVARAVLGLPEATTEEIQAGLEQTPLWLKRDPVLHPHGLLRVRGRLIQDGARVLRLPPALLGPLAADFDGDTAVVFGVLPGVASTPPEGGSDQPARGVLHPRLRKAVFVAGKQYRHGLIRFAIEERKDPDAPVSMEEIEKWLKQVAEPDAAALAALAGDPGMGLGLMPLETLGELAVVRYRASKLDVKAGGPLLKLLLEGNAWSLFPSGTCSEDQPSATLPPDPIRQVIVAGRRSVGRFGIAPRRLVHALRPLSDPNADGWDRAAFAKALWLSGSLTEQATQRTLSVKAGSGPMKFQPFDDLVKWLCGKHENVRPQSREDPHLSELLASFQSAVEPGDSDPFEAFRKWTSGDQAPWLAWLDAPERLKDLLPRDGVLVIPFDDPRGAVFVESSRP